MFHNVNHAHLWKILHRGLSFFLIFMVMLGTLPRGIAQAENVTEAEPAQLSGAQPQEYQPPPSYTEPTAPYESPEYDPYPPRTYTSTSTTTFGALDVFEPVEGMTASGDFLITGSSGTGGSLPGGIDVRSLPAGITVDLTYNVVMGWVEAEDTVEVTVGTNGYGMAVADDVGFFWTPVWDNTTGRTFDVDCGMGISILVNLTTSYDITPPCMDAGLNIAADQVYGEIIGDTGGTDFTARLGGFDIGSGGQPPVLGAPSVPITTLGNGSFATTFPGVDLGAESIVALDRVVDGVNIRSYAYPEPSVFMVQQYNTIAGYAPIGQSVAATVFADDTKVDVVWEGSTTANAPHGYYLFQNVEMTIGNFIEVGPPGDPFISTTVIELGNLDFLTTSGWLAGTAPVGASVRASWWPWSGEERLYKQALTSAVSGNSFSMDLSSIGLKARDDVLVVVADAAGNQVQLLSGMPFLNAWLDLQSDLDCVVGRLDGPGLPIHTRLEKTGEEPYTRDTGMYSDAGNSIVYCFTMRDASSNYVNFSPGDVMTLHSGDPLAWAGSVEIVDMNWSGDTALNSISGTLPAGDLEVAVVQWNGWAYPLHGWANRQITHGVSGGFTASFGSFDVRDGNLVYLSHFDQNGYGNHTHNWIESENLAFFEIYPTYNTIGGKVDSPGSVVTAILYDVDGVTELARTSDDRDGHPYWFWLDDFDGYALQPGYTVVVSTTTGWQAEMVIPALAIDADVTTDTITASGPAGLLFIEVNDGDYGLSLFVPGPDVFLNLSHYGFDLQPSATVAVTYEAPDGNRARVETMDLILNVNYSHDWIEGSYAPGYPVTLKVYQSDKTNLKATAYTTTGELPWWGGGTGFSTNYNTTWDPEQPNIEPNDWVIGTIDVDGTLYEAEVQIGLITGDVDLATNSISGTVYAPLLPQDVPVEVQCHAWGAPEWTEGKSDSVLPDGLDTYTCAWDPATEWDIQPGQDIAVLYRDPGGHWIFSVHRGYSDELVLNIHYDHNWIDGYYKPGHTVYLEVRDGDDNFKASTTLETQVFDDWGWSGFVTYREGTVWSPSHPDIQPGDTVRGEVDDGTEFWAEVKIGTITGTPNIDTDSITGTVAATWLGTDPVDVACSIWEQDGREVWDTVVPDGVDPYVCVFDGDNYFDIVPGTQLMVFYDEPGGHRIIGDFSPPSPHLRIDKSFFGENLVAEGGNAAFRVQYQNQGGLAAENVTITETLEGMTYLWDSSGITPDVVGNQVTWNMGPVGPGDDWISFVVYAEVTALVGQPVSNTAHISTSTPYDQGDQSEKTSTWEGTVVANDTYLNVGKWPWTWNPAPGEDFVYHVSVCNNGSTGSSAVTLTDTLPGAVSFVSWWADDPGWSEVDVSGDPLIFEHTCISSYSCSDLYIVVNVDTLTEVGTELVNRAEISGGNDLSADDNMTEMQHHVGGPNMDLGIQHYWHWGSLVPGGHYRYGLNYQNHGNLPAAGDVEITATLPEGTTFAGWDSWGLGDVSYVDMVGNVVTWTVSGLKAGYGGTIEVWVNINSGTAPGTSLVHEATIEIQVGEVNTEDNYSRMEEMVYGHGPNLRVNKRGEWHSNETDKYGWYEIHVENIGDQTVNNVVITDTFPAGMTFQDGPYVHFWGGWTFDQNPEGFTITLLDQMEPGWNFHIHFTLTLDDLAPGHIYTNTVEITPLVNDVNPEDNTATAILFSGPDMFIEKTWVDGDFKPGTEVTYLLHFGNAQTAWWWGMAGNAVITDTLPEGMTYVSAQLRWCESTEWCEATPTIDGQTLTWNLYPIPSSNWNEILLTVQIDQAVAKNNPLINHVTIASEHPNDIDPYPDNNQSSFDPELTGTFNIFLPLILR